MKRVIKSHAWAIGSAAVFAMLIIAFGLVLSGTLYLIIGRTGRGTSEKLSDISGMASD